MAGGPGVGEVAVIGTGSSGLAVLRALREQGVPVVGFERGSAVGGMWRYENDSGLSSTYASLRTNVSRSRMQYPSFPMPESFGDFPHHTDMATYLDAYAETFGLRKLIGFRTTVERLEPDPDGGWWVSLDDGSVHRFGVVVVATGLHWCPKFPDDTGGSTDFTGEVSHSHDYRVPQPFAGRRVLVVGAGQSATEIAVEVAAVATDTFLSVRGGAHVIPRWIGGRPYDAADVEPLNRIPWRLLNLLYRRDVDRELGSPPSSWPVPPRRLLEGIPIISSDLLPAVRRGEIAVRPAIERLAGDQVRFVDGTEECIDQIVYATGYRISVPFLAPSLVSPRGLDLPLYRRILPAGVGGLFLAGFVVPPGGLLPVVEAQADWIAAVLTGRLSVPPPTRVARANDRAERRTRQRFPGESAHSVRCDPHAYRRLLRADLRRAQ